MAANPINETCAIPQALLDRSGKGLINGEFHDFQACLHVPHTIETFEGSNRLETLTDLRNLFDDLREFVTSHGIDRLVRICTQALQKSPTHIEATHESFFFNGARQVIKPMISLTRVEQVDRAWKFTGSQYAAPQSPALSMALNGTKWRSHSKIKD